MIPNLQTLQEYISTTLSQFADNQSVFEREKNKIYSMLGDTVEILEASGAILAGGAITSLFTNSPINDFDIYFRDKESFNKFLAGMYSGETSYKTIVSVTNRSVLLTDHQEGKLQLVVYKWFPTVQDVFADFDFTVNMGAYDFFEKKFIFDDNFFKHNAQKYLSINTNTAYPLISVLRVDKYREKGYTVSKAQLLRLLFRVSQFNFESWDDVLDHVGGMYGIDPEKIFDKTKEFSIEEVISQLSKIESIDNTWTPGIYGRSDLVKKLNGYLTDEMRSLLKEGRSDLFLELAY